MYVRIHVIVLSHFFFRRPRLINACPPLNYPTLPHPDNAQSNFVGRGINTFHSFTLSSLHIGNELWLIFYDSFFFAFVFVFIFLFFLFLFLL